MNELIQPSSPLWASILLVTLIAIIVVSIFSFFVAAISRNTKLGQISLHTATASMISFFGLLIAIVFISEHVMTNPNTEAFYAYFDDRLNDTDNPYIHEMYEKMFQFMDDSPSVIELLNQYREALLPPDYDMV